MSAERQHRTHRQALSDDLTSLHVSIEAGDSHVSIRAHDGPDLLAAEFDFDPRFHSEPTLSLADGRLHISAPPHPNPAKGSHQPALWTLSFHPRLLIALESHISSGKLDLDAANLNLSEAVAVVKSGHIRAAFSGSYPELDAIALRTISGYLDTDLKADFPRLQEVVLDSMSGQIQLETAGAFGALENLSLHQRSGNTSLKLGGDFTVPLKFSLNSSSGSPRLHFLGHYSGGLYGTIESLSGNTRVVLPSSHALSIGARAFSGHVLASEPMVQRGTQWLNPKAPAPAPQVQLNINSKSGTIHLVLDEERTSTHDG